VAEIVQAAAPDRIKEVRELILEYALTLSCEPCLQRIEQDVAHLPGEYAPPDGRLLLALDDGKPAGCVALRKIGEDAFEMRRLYVPRAFRGGRSARPWRNTASRRRARKPAACDLYPPVHERGHPPVPLPRIPGHRSYGEHVIEGAFYMELIINSVLAE
jgi:hypothetical protein